LIEYSIDTAGNERSNYHLTGNEYTVDGEKINHFENCNLSGTNISLEFGTTQFGENVDFSNNNFSNVELNLDDSSFNIKCFFPHNHIAFDNFGDLDVLPNFSNTGLRISVSNSYEQLSEEENSELVSLGRRFRMLSDDERNEYNRLYSIKGRYLSIKMVAEMIKTGKLYNCYVNGKKILPPEECDRRKNELLQEYNDYKAGVFKTIRKQLNQKN